MLELVDSAYWKVDRTLGKEKSDRINLQPDTIPPGPSYQDIKLDKPPIGQLLSG